MGNHLAVCIGRQFGSGGREIGRLVAAKMGMEFYDKALLKEAAKKSGIVEEMFEKADEKPTSSLLYSLSMAATGSKAPTFNEYTAYMPNDRLQNYISQVIREAAEKSPCVIIGRCADYVLRGREKTFSLFLHAELETRIGRIAKKQNLDEDAARALIRKTDRSRANYYSFYTDRDWGAADNYDMALNAGRFSVDQTVDTICRVLQQLYGENPAG
ncbi:cytidylate kinase-like family protein [Ruminococcaceae bacterium OttesenSCG-928-I18]|nr:cytidylate kinase-like family protein [Ruminococcaceae bacterium OttesenSCG-928-I18]